MVEAASKWRKRFIEEHGFASRRLVEIEEVISSQRVFCMRDGRKKVGHQLVENTRRTLVLPVEGQTSITNLDCPAVRYPILQRIAPEHSYCGQQINPGLRQSLLVKAPIPATHPQGPGEKNEHGEQNKAQRHNPLIQDEGIQNKKTRGDARC